MKKMCKDKREMTTVKRVMAIALSAMILAQQVDVRATEAEESWFSETVSGNEASVSSGDADTPQQNTPVPFEREFRVEDYCITFSEESGVCGMIVDAQLEYKGSDSEDCEELKLEWRADASRLTPLGQSSGGEGVLSVQSYRIKANETSALKVSVDLYRKNGAYFGTVESGEFALKRDMTAPEIDFIKYSIGGGALTEVSEEARIEGCGSLVLQVSAKDASVSSEEEAASGMNQVWVHFGQADYGMSFDSAQDVWSLEIEIPDGAYVSEKPVLYAEDKAGNKSEISLPEVVIDKELPVLFLSVKAGEENVTDWYSEAIHEEGLRLQAEASDASGIQKIEFAKDEGFLEILESHVFAKEDETGNIVVQTGDGVVSGDQKQRYYVRALDRWGNTVCGSVEVKIDNTAPRDEVTVQFCGTQDMLVQLADSEDGECEYILSQKEGLIYDKEALSLVLIMEDASKDGIRSGIAAVNFVLQSKDGVTGEEVRKHVAIGGDQIYTGEKDGKNSTYYYIGIPDSDIFEKSFQICDLYITDKAGNVCPSTVESGSAGMQDQVLYYVDNSAPRILYTYGTDEIAPYSVEESEEGRIQYFNRYFTATVEITDANLTEAQVKNAAVEGNAQAAMKRLAEDEEEALKSREIYQYTLDADGTWQFSVAADDILHNGRINGELIPVLSDTIVTDTIAPQIKLEVCDASGKAVSDYAGTYFARNMTVQMRIEELHLEPKSIETVISGISASGEAIEIFLEPDSWNAEGAVYTNQYQITEEGCYSVRVTCLDKAGNSSENATEDFCIDKTAPTVEITYDNNEPLNQFYYNAVRTATVTVTDYSFDADKAQFLAESVYGNQPVIGEWVHEGAGNCDGSRHTSDCTYSAQAVFRLDDIYDFSFSCTDKAGLQSAPYEKDHFVVDQTAPVIRITFDYNEVSHEYFYNQVRTAAIEIEDISFDEKLVKVEKTENESVDSLPGLGSFSGSGKNHTASMRFDRDGIYQFMTDAEDLAGNKAEVEICPLFIIDMTEPELVISGVGAFSANKGSVMPQVEYRDTYLYDPDSILELTGYYHGSTEVGFTKEETEEGYLVSFDDFPYTKETDDLYTLHVSIRDYAGNETEDSLTFSVNRFGSVYVLSDATRQALENYYVPEAPEVVITEINVDDLPYRQVTTSLNGETVVLQEGNDYTIQKQGTQMTWKSYSYILLAGNFDAQGHYVVTVSSRDHADNSSDNRSKGTEVAFAVDKTAPSIVVSGIEDQGVYQEEQLTVRANIQDNMGLSGVLVYDGSTVIAEYDPAALEENYGEISFVLEENDRPRTVRIIALDLAGNQQEETYSEVWVTTKAYQLQDTKTPLAAAPEKGNMQQPIKYLLWILPLAVVLVFGGAGFLLVLKRRKENR